MAPIYRSNVSKRGLDSSIIFNIIFGCIAFVVIVFCFIWGFVWPWYAKKYWNFKHPSRTVARDEREQARIRHLDSSSHTPAFRSHPAVLHDIRLNSLSANSHVRTYDPRCETPFRNHPQHGETLSLPSQTPRPGSHLPLTYAPSSEGLFTPTRALPTVRERLQARSTTMPRTRAEFDKVKSIVTERDFGDAKEYILAIPEPLVLKARDAGQAPAPIKSLQGFDTPKSTTSSDKHLHPKKLFESLSKHGPRASECSTTSLKVSDRSGYSSVRQSEIGTVEETCEAQCAVEDDKTKQESEVESIADMSGSDSASEDSRSGLHNSSVAAMHRLRSYRSLTGARPHQPLTRAGTLTRPKTPVADISKLFDRTVSEDSTHISHYPRDEISTATEPVTAPTSSEKAPSSTAGTSIDITVSSLSLLPTPLKVSSTTMTKETSWISLNETECRTNAFPEELAGSLSNRDRNALKLRAGLGNSRNMKSRISRKRPAPINVRADTRASKRRSAVFRSNSSEGSMLAPLVRYKSPQGRGRNSSIYSRDTRGVSIARTPVSPDFPSELGCTPVSPYFSALDTGNPGNKSGFSDKEHKSSSPVDVVKTKVDNWKLHIDETSWKASRSSSLKRALSRFGPRKISNRARQSADTGTTSVISSEINTDEAATVRESVPRICINVPDGNEARYQDSHTEQGTASENQGIAIAGSNSMLVAVAKENAPGGAQWV